MPALWMRVADRALPLVAAASLVGALGTAVRRDRAAERRYDPITAALRTAGRSARAGQPAIALVFRAGDCATRLDVVDDLNRLAQSGAAAVTGLLLEERPSTALAAEIQRANGITFPVEAVPQESALAFATLIHARTPIVMVLDSAGALRQVLDGDVSDSLSRLAVHRK